MNHKQTLIVPKFNISFVFHDWQSRGIIIISKKLDLQPQDTQNPKINTKNSYNKNTELFLTITTKIRKHTNIPNEPNNVFIIVLFD